MGSNLTRRTIFWAISSAVRAPALHAGGQWFKSTIAHHVIIFKRQLSVPYDLNLERKLDRLSAKLGPFTKKNLFGGVAYLLNGNMAFGVNKQSSIVRTSKERAKELLTRDFISIFDITVRPMMGWLLVSPGGLGTENQISDLLHIAIDYVKTLPRK